MLAVTLTLVGFAYDAGTGTKALSAAFTVCYVTGCVLAVLAVRQSGIFSTIVQPPLILFVAVPSSYFMFHGGDIHGIKDILINCGYPLIERFPLMFFTAVTVLAIGAARWYLHTSAVRSGGAVAADGDAPAAPARRSRRRATTATDDAPAEEATPARRQRRHTVDRTASASASASDDDAPRPRRRTSTGGASRSRHSRPPETEIIEAVSARPRRPRPPVDGEPRRRPRPDEARERRNGPPVERRGERTRAERPVRRERPDRYDYPDRADRPERQERPERAERPQRRHRMPEYGPYDTYDYDSYQPSAPSGGTHHPVSRVRYRGSDDDDQPLDPRTEQRRPRRSRDADSWEYDV